MRVLVIGGSAGSVGPLAAIVGAAPRLDDLAVLVVVHVKAQSDHLLGISLRHHTELPVRVADDFDPLLGGEVVMAPSGHHMLVDEGSLRLSVDEKVVFSRPSIDVLFQSVADSVGKDAIGVLLSGANRDGAAGLHALRKRGARTFVQDPTSAEFPFMPDAALSLDPQHTCLSVQEIAERVRALGDQ